MHEELFRNLKSPGIWQSLRELLHPRELECLQIEVSSCCSGRCTYCPHTVQSDIWNSRHMKPETFAAIWPAMLRSTRIHLQGWGEPFLNPYFMDYARLGIRAGCRVSTTTCGLVMNEGLAEEIVDSGIDVVAFSLTGTDTVSNSARARVPFSKVEQAVKQLQDIRRQKNGVHLEIHLAYLMMASNVDAVRRLPDLMDDWGVHSVVISTLDYLPSENLRSEAFLPHEREKIESARSVLEEVGQQVKNAGRDFFASLPMPAPAPQCREHAHKTLYIDADGIISPCVYLNVPMSIPNPNTTIFGNINTDAFDAVWNTPDYTAFRTAIQTAEPPESCQGCPKRFESFCS
jgi:radical SAM protein with 4Fe4S-binding SPASM domain